MELYEQILSAYCAECRCRINGTQIVRDCCYRAMCAIQAVLADDTLEDPACFERIEQIVRIFEALGSDAGSRHDFG